MSEESDEWPREYIELGPGDGVKAEVILLLHRCSSCQGETYVGDEPWPPCPACDGSGKSPPTQPPSSESGMEER